MIMAASSSEPFRVRGITQTRSLAICAIVFSGDRIGWRDDVRNADGMKFFSMPIRAASASPVLDRCP
jgi:hypothetical protein